MVAYIKIVFSFTQIDRYRLLRFVPVTYSVVKEYLFRTSVTNGGQISLRSEFEFICQSSLSASISLKRYCQHINFLSKLCRSMVIYKASVCLNLKSNLKSNVLVTTLFVLVQYEEIRKSLYFD